MIPPANQVATCYDISVRDQAKLKEAQARFYINVVRKRREAWMLENGPCRECKAWDCLELDHIDPATKVAHNIWSWSDDRRIKELAKCQPLCYTCHKAKTLEYLKAINPVVVTHGIVSGYLDHGCRCDLCVTFYKKWRREKYLRIGK